MNHSAAESSVGGIAGGGRGQSDKDHPGSSQGLAFVSHSAAESSVGGVTGGGRQRDKD